MYDSRLLRVAMALAEGVGDEMAELDLDPNPALRAELTAALAVLNPRIQGFVDLIRATISPGLADLLRAGLGEHTRRRDLIDAVITDLDETQAARVALRGDGYPQPLQASASAQLFAELARVLAAEAAAVAIFEEEATVITMVPGIPSDKPRKD